MEGGCPQEGLISVKEALANLRISVSTNERTLQEKLSGGLTNDNVLVTISNSNGVITRKLVLRRFVIRTSQHLKYNRQQEYLNSCIAYTDKGVGASVIGYVPATQVHGGALALDFVDGKTMDEETIQTLCSSTSTIVPLVTALKQLHSSPSTFKNRFNPFKARVHYEEQVRLLSGRAVAWDGYDVLVQQLYRVHDYLASSPEPLVDCHNDLLSANFLDLSPQITIIDWELSGQAEPSWELGNFISENHLDGKEADIHRLVSLYWGQSSSSRFIDEKLKRAKLYSIVSKITWAAWGAVLYHLDKADAFDYQQWSMDKIMKARATLSNPDILNELCDD